MTIYRKKHQLVDISELLDLIPEVEDKLYFENLLQDDVLTNTNPVTNKEYTNIIFLRNAVQKKHIDEYVRLLRKYKNEKRIIGNYSKVVFFDKEYNIAPMKVNESINVFHDHISALEESINQHNTIQVYVNVEEYKYTNKSFKALLQD